MGQYADSGEVGAVDAVALAHELAAALRDVVAYDAAVNSRHAVPAGLQLDGLGTVIGHWAHPTPLDAYTEWPEPWIRLYQALRRLPPPGAAGPDVLR